MTSTEREFIIGLPKADAKECAAQRARAKLLADGRTPSLHHADVVFERSFTVSAVSH